jgi:hypothetical protein
LASPEAHSGEALRDLSVLSVEPLAPVELKQATIGWPSVEVEGVETERAFVMRGLDVEFPKGQLSLIAGEWIKV